MELEIFFHRVYGMHCLMKCRNWFKVAFPIMFPCMCFLYTHSLQRLEMPLNFWPFESCFYKYVQKNVYSGLQTQ